MDKRVLVVDDNATNRNILIHYLDSWHMRTDLVDSGKAALERINSGHDYDLILLDLQMPGMDGLTVAEKLKQQPDYLSVPIIVLTSTGHLSEEDVRTQLLAKSVTKPVKPSVLFDVLIETLAIGESKTISKYRPAQPADKEIQLMSKILPLRILLAEDNLVNQKVAQKMLEKLGYRIDIVSDGLEAVEAVQARPYDLVLMDILMPNLDGIGATKRIHELIPVGKRPKIIVMTANALIGDRERYLEAGMDDYVSKPVRLGELQAAILRISNREVATSKENLV
ncbi:MAG: response regulator [Chloroflexota bacterium]